MTLTVHTLDVAGWVWRFDDSSLTWRHRQYGHMARFDPFPAYAHDEQLARETLTTVGALCPPPWTIELYLANREEVARTNGHSNIHEAGHYDDAGTWTKDPPVGVILLSGKRIPPHPAMTRYLVAHEYGHHVKWMLSGARDAKTLWSDDVYREYLDVRGLTAAHLHGGEGGTWHDSAQEIFACDFRILIAGIEPEFWPHPGIAYPDDTLRPWWDAALREIEVARHANHD